MRRVLSAVILLAFASTALAAPVPKGIKRKLLIVSMRSGSAGLILVDDDGRNATPLTNDKFHNSYPAWSPDGTKIAFCSNRAGGPLHIYTMDADGKNVKALTTGGLQCRVPAWSPDGKSIAFCRSNPNGGSNICVIPADGGEIKALDGDAWDPAWSPDGKSLAFVSLRDGDGFRLHRMTADGKDAKCLFPKGNNFGNAYPTWSPDGKTILWSHGVNNNLELHAVGADGSNPKPITKIGAGLCLYPSWSPDGKKIAYVSLPRGQKGTIQVMDADGGNAKAIVSDEAYVEGGRPVWKPR
ncbi:MAG: PD40 domain-containing protein [Planctomycetia bacterium]|nr:PD40 domain-containing protein [Planctomycetia bacterium]